MRINFEGEGYRVSTAADLAEARRALNATQPDMVVLDLGLPDGDGRVLINEIFQAQPQCRILVLSARADEIDRVTALQLGADDYMIKPFSVLELLARVQIRLFDRRSAIQKVKIGNATGDLETQTVTRGSKCSSLTRQQSRVLAVLLRHRNMPVPREQ